jgi:hypothetical protein
MSLRALYDHVDECWKECAPLWRRVQLASGLRQRERAGQMSASEVMTILILFHELRDRDFKTYYTRQVPVYWRAAFPALVSYRRFIALVPPVVVPLCADLQGCLGACRGISSVDATALAVCHNRRISSHRVFRAVAARGKTSVDWVYGFKLPVVLNACGALLAWRLTPGTVDDRTPVPALVRALWGKLFGDKGYLCGPLTQQLVAQRLQLITRIKTTMTNRLLLLDDRLLLDKRGLVDAVIDVLKNACQIEHARHRSLTGCFATLLAGLTAYCHRPRKPSLHHAAPILIPN